jgi:hypothetical protein
LNPEIPGRKPREIGEEIRTRFWRVVTEAMTNLGTTDITFMEIIHGCAEERGETGRACVELVMDMPFEKVSISSVSSV